MSKILRSLLVIIAVATIAIGATTAAWTDSQIVSTNNFTTGTLDLTTAPATALFTAANIYPSWNQEKSIVITNNGSLSLTYNIAASKASGDDALYTSPKFLLQIGTTSGGSNVYNGTVSGLATLASPRTLAASANETLYFKITLDSTADNTLQGKSADVTFTFSAIQ